MDDSDFTDCAGYKVEKWRFDVTKKDYDDAKYKLEFYIKLCDFYKVNSKEYLAILCGIENLLDSAFQNGLYVGFPDCSFGFDRCLPLEEINRMFKIKDSFVYYSIRHYAINNALIYFQTLINKYRERYIENIEKQWVSNFHKEGLMHRLQGVNNDRQA